LVAFGSSSPTTSALKLSAVIPRYRVSNNDTAPRRIGSPSGLTFLVSETNGFSMVAMEPSLRRTATAIFEGERIITPSSTA